MERGNTAQWLEGGEPPILECFTYIRGKQHVGQIHVSLSATSYYQLSFIGLGKFLFTIKSITFNFSVLR